MRPPDLPFYFTRRQARERGISDFRLAGMVRRGEIRRVRSGLYSRDGPGLDDPVQRSEVHEVAARAALTHHASGFVASHLTAAAVHRLPLPLGPTGWVHVTAVESTQRSREAPGVWVHHADSTPTEFIEVDGLRVTTVARTIADCLRGWGPRVSVPIADAALHRRLLVGEDIVAMLDRQRRWRGRPRALRTLPLIDGRRESWLESYGFVLFDEWAITLPEPQVVVVDRFGGAVGRVDGAWLEDATVVEFDGLGKYTMPIEEVVDPSMVWRVEKRRYDGMGNLGLERVRFGLEDLLHHGASVRAVIRARRAAGSRSRFSGSFQPTDATGLRCFLTFRARRPRKLANV